MPLEIKILDYGDIELESSFLVLGRGCGRTRRVPTLGFLILGGPWPMVVDTGYRSNQIMETLGMRGLQFHENMIENQLGRHGVRMGDVRYVMHTKNALRFLDLEISGPTEICPGVYCDAAGAHTEGSMNVHVHTADGIATISGDVTYDFIDQIIERYHEITCTEPSDTGTHAATKR